MLQPVIIAGGSGTRLWPLSRHLYPKQFLPLTGDRSMLQLTIDRLAGLDCAPPIIVCNEEHRFIAAEQLRQGGLAHNGIILESSGRNTAPAIGRGDFSQQDAAGITCRSPYGLPRGFYASGNGRGSGRTTGVAGHFRHYTQPCGDGLRLYQG